MGKNGNWIYWTYDGQKYLEENYNNDIKDGLFIEWHDNGIKKQECSFEEGFESGIWIYWNDEGKKYLQESYKGKR